MDGNTEYGVDGYGYLSPGPDLGLRFPDRSPISSRDCVAMFPPYFYLYLYLYPCLFLYPHRSIAMGTGTGMWVWLGWWV